MEKDKKRAGTCPGFWNKKVREGTLTFLFQKAQGTSSLAFSPFPFQHLATWTRRKDCSVPSEKTAR